MESVEPLAGLSAGVAVLSLAGYALPVRFRVRDRVVECLVPTWSGVGDLLTEADQALLVQVEEGGAALRWLLVRGPASLVTDPDWDGLLPRSIGQIAPEDLYQLLRIRPKRIERVDEARGWGYRETLDL